jgi:hypothetical protein
MRNDVTLLDRLRIERAVWSVDQRLYDLPRRTRIERRRELRANLLDAASDTGATVALRDVGDSATLAADYLDAELGHGPRHSWMAAMAFLLTTTLVLSSLFFDAAQAFGDGILAGNPDATGTFTWPGISHLQSAVTYTVSGGEHTFAGGDFTPVTWVLLGIGTIAVGRLWRALPSWRRHRAPVSATGVRGD